MDAREYQPQNILTDPEQRQRIQAEIEAERAAEAERERQRIAQAQAEQARLAALEASRPYPLRLQKMRCGTCHPLDSLETIRHTQAGWFLTIQRMRWLNGAKSITFTETRVLSQHFSKTQGKTGIAAIGEYLLIAMLPLLLLLTVIWRMSKKRYTTTLNA